MTSRSINWWMQVRTQNFVKIFQIWLLDAPILLPTSEEKFKAIMLYKLELKELILSCFF